MKNNTVTAGKEYNKAIPHFYITGFSFRTSKKHWIMYQL